MLFIPALERNPFVFAFRDYSHRKQRRVLGQGPESERPARFEKHRFHSDQLGLLHWAVSHRGELNK